MMLLVGAVDMGIIFLNTDLSTGQYERQKFSRQKNYLYSII